MGYDCNVSCTLKLPYSNDSIKKVLNRKDPASNKYTNLNGEILPDVDSILASFEDRGQVGDGYFSVYLYDQDKSSYLSIMFSKNGLFLGVQGSWYSGDCEYLTRKHRYACDFRYCMIFMFHWLQEFEMSKLEVYRWD